MDLAGVERQKIFRELKRSEVTQYFFPDVMLSRKVDWSVLAQCDSFAVEKFVETSNRKAMRCVETMREASFNRKLENNRKLEASFK